MKTGVKTQQKFAFFPDAFPCKRSPSVNNWMCAVSKRGAVPKRRAISIRGAVSVWGNTVIMLSSCLHFDDGRPKVHVHLTVSSTHAHRASPHTQHHLNLHAPLVSRVSVCGVKFLWQISFCGLPSSTKNSPHKNFSPRTFSQWNIVTMKISAFTVG